MNIYRNTSLYIIETWSFARLGMHVEVYAPQYTLDVFPIRPNIYLGPSPSIVSVKESLLMTENPILIETSFADAVAIIAVAPELSEQTRRHWPTSMRQDRSSLGQAAGGDPSALQWHSSRSLSVTPSAGGSNRQDAAKPQEQYEERFTLAGSGEGRSRARRALNSRMGKAASRGQGRCCSI